MKPKKKGKKATKAVEIPYLAVRAHDILCPCISKKAARKAYGDVTPEMLDPDFFQGRLAEAAAARKATPGSIAEVNAAYQAATGLQTLTPKTFADLARAAHKGFLTANPGLPNLKPGLISPEQFRRPFLAGADDTVSHTTTVSSPSLKPTIDAGQFDRGPLTANETRPTLVGGTSVAKGVGTMDPPKIGRTFYTNAAASEHTTQMGDLHDWIASTFPGVCPVAMPEGSMTDSDGQMGRPAEMNAALPPKGPVVDTKADATITPVKDTARANKGAGASLESAEVEALVKRRLKKVTKGFRQETRTLRRQLKAMAASPDPRLAPNRGPRFGSATKAATTDPERLERARQAKELVLSRDSREAAEGLQMAREMGMTPRQIAALAVD